jgi:anthraniloyl-CoA monooxygenase
MAPEAVRRGLAQFAGCLELDVPDADRAAWILSRPLAMNGRSWPHRAVNATELSGYPKVFLALEDPYGSEGDRILKQVAGALGDSRGDRGIVLTTADEAEAVLTMFDVGERLRRESGVVVAARVDQRWSKLAADALASGRIDLVALQGDC